MLQAEHLDEGTLHALIDGELDSDQQAEAERHLADCAECRRHADEARSMLEEADELIERLDPPPFVMLPEGRSMGGGNRLDPVVLIPPEPETPRPGAGRPYGARRPKRPDRPFAPPRYGRFVAIAAGLLVVAGAGYLVTRDGSDARDVQLARTEAPSEPTMSGFERSTAGAPEAGAESLATPDSAALLATEAAGDTGADAAALDAGAAGAVAASPDAREAAPPSDQQRQLAARDEPAPRQRTPTAAQLAATRRAAADRAAEAAERDVAARTQAALEATAEQAAPAPAAAPAPPPDPVSALERRAGVYSRIGLDEASRMLGSPAHAILDLRPQFVGLAPSAGVPGADPGRPLVRVVYLDPSQRLIMLDQQRQSGDLPAGTSNLIILGRGGVRLWLHGAVSPATLRDLAERVR